MYNYCLIYQIKKRICKVNFINHPLLNFYKNYSSKIESIFFNKKLAI